MGTWTTRDLLKGMGFTGGMKQFRKFLKTGEIPEDFGKKPKSNKNKYPEILRERGPNPPTGPTQHIGGWAGETNSRKGVARNLKGLHSSETMIRAQKGEYIVNRDAASKHAGLLESINSGKGAGGLGFPALLTGTMQKMFSNAVSQGVVRKGVQAKINEARQRQLALYSGEIGDNIYNLGNVFPWVAEAANYLGHKFNIATIGGVGDRAANHSDHPMGLALDFMTGLSEGGIAKGWASTKEALRLQQVLDATYMIFRAQIHSFDSRGWQPYSHPSGATDPTSMHMDHVHLSFSPTVRHGDLPALATGCTSGPGWKPSTN